DVIILLLILSLISFPDWPQFRGPTGQGISDERNLPLSWSETKNVHWKVEIPGRGWSSPVIQGDRIWLTTATEEGRSLRAIAVDVNTGAIQQNVEVFRLKSPKLTNGKNSFASPTPIVEGDRVYLHFGATERRVSRKRVRSFGKRSSNTTTASMDQAVR